jgi:carbamoyl-phosphate synthase small subunit
MIGLDLAREVTCAEAYHVDGPAKGKFKVVAYDFGMKTNIGRMLAAAGCDVTVVPATTSAEDTLALKPDGVFLSNGPGDPEPCTYAIEASRRIMEKEVPIFGICLGHQILGLACGAKTFKLKFGHRGANHPVKDLETGKIEITSQNHGFAVLGPGGRRTIDTDEAVRWETDFGTAELQQLNLYDRTVEGLVLRDVPASTVQYHPEAGPGPHDALHLFDRFLDTLRVPA